MTDQSQSERFELKDYKTIRTHRFLRDRVRTLLQPKLKPKTTKNITSSCIVLGQDTSTKNFNADVKGKQLALYDGNTYAECSFDQIYKDSKDIWPKIEQARTSGNLLVVYFEQSPLSRNVFLNEYLVGKFLKSQERPPISEQDYGMLERAIRSTLQTIDKTNHEQLLVSVLGVTGTNIVDLLNLERKGSGNEKQIKRIRVKREGKGVQAENLSQIAIDSNESLMNILMLANYLKAMHKQLTGERMEAELFQLSIGRMSKEKDQIQQIIRKLNFVRLCQQSLVTNSLGCCLKEIAEGFTKVSARSNKLTFFLEDCLNSTSDIHLVYEVDTEQPIRAQVSMLSFGSCINRPITLRKNYIGDKEVISRLIQYGNELTLQNLLTMDSRDRNERSMRKTRGVKYDVKVNRSLLSQTTSSMHKRRSASNSTTSRKAQQALLPPAQKAPSRLSEHARYVHLKKIYRDIF